jgi:flavin-dependent dehydrogenase
MTSRDCQSIEIVGGGLAGLSLGLALRRRGVPVTVFEAHDYPRHRVCGEFITGLDDDTVNRLGLGPLLADALRHRQVAWYQRNQAVQSQRLPSPALGISRHRLDARLAEAFVEAGGNLRLHTRIDLEAQPAGRVFATGRRPRPSPWIGLKVHVRNLPRVGGLEVHLGDRVYVGLSAIEDEKVNVCGLFRRRPISPGKPPAPDSGLLLRYLEASGLTALAGRLREADLDESSFCAVAAVNFQMEPSRPGRLCLGDSFAMTPPFTGNGMALALQSAALALDPLADWVRGGSAWPDTVAAVSQSLHRHFRARIASANLLHPFLLEPRRQIWLARAGRARLLPMRLLYHLTH